MVYIVDAAPEAAKALCAAAAGALQAELARHAPPLALLALGDAPLAGRPAAALGRRSFAQCCKLFRAAAALRAVVSPVALPVSPPPLPPSPPSPPHPRAPRRPHPPTNPAAPPHQRAGPPP